ncbi:MAG: hypothetical protein RSE54_07550 [Ruthenibacterium sp.]
MKTASKLLSLALCCAMAFSFTGCRFTSPANVMRVEDTDIPAGLYLLYQLQAYSSAVDLQTDKTTDVLKDTLEGKTGAEWIHAETVRLARRYVYIEKQFEAEGLSLTADEQSAAQTQAASGFTASADTFSANGIGQTSYTQYYISETKYDRLFTAYSDKNGKDISDDTAKAYMDKTYAHISTLMLPASDTAGAALNDADTAKVQAVADKLEKTLTAGGSMEKLGEDALKEAFAICGREYTADALSQYQLTTFVSDKSNYFDADTTAAMRSAKVNGAGQTTYGGAPMVYQKTANYKDNEDFVANYRSSIVSNICLEQFSAQIEAESAKYAVTENAGAVKTYSPKKIVQK